MRKDIIYFACLCWLFLGISCNDNTTDNENNASAENLVAGDSINMDTLEIAIEPPSASPTILDTSELEYALIDQGLVDVHALNKEIVTDIKYSSKDNFLHEDVYEDFDKCYLLPDVAERLVKVQAMIMDNHPDLRLLIFDCVRPRSVQMKMWDIVKGTDQQKYVAFPGGSGSMHNYGAAIDLGLLHVDTGLVDMGTPFDYFGDLAQPRYEDAFAKEGKLTNDQVKNRRILRAAMIHHGFHGILSEWWHFNGFPRAEVKQRFQIVE